jgi:hypothetical protein
LTAQNDGETEASQITVANEFAEVQIRKVKSKNGERLEIVSPKLGYAVQLDALVLESLTWQRSPYAFSRFLRKPFGN